MLNIWLQFIEFLFLLRKIYLFIWSLNQDKFYHNSCHTFFTMCCVFSSTRAYFKDP